MELLRVKGAQDFKSQWPTKEKVKVANALKDRWLNMRKNPTLLKQEDIELAELRWRRFIMTDKWVKVDKNE